MGNLTEHENKVINYSQRMAKLSLIGLLIPFLGLYLAVIALNNIKNPPSNARHSKKVHLVKSFAVIGIIISLISASGWVGYYFVQTNSARQSNAKIRAKEKALNDTLFKCKEFADRKSQKYLIDNRDISKGTNALVDENIPKEVKYKSSKIKAQGYEKCYQEFNSSIDK